MVVETDSEIVLETTAADPEVTAKHRILPFSFAKRHGFLIHAYEDGQAQTLVAA